jgi:hypothetical protein
LLRIVRGKSGAQGKELHPGLLREAYPRTRKTVLLRKLDVRLIRRGVGKEGDIRGVKYLSYSTRLDAP